MVGGYKSAAQPIISKPDKTCFNDCSYWCENLKILTVVLKIFTKVLQKLSQKWITKTYGQ